jgi:apolipoprotein D and lipocalin family protein
LEGIDGCLRVLYTGLINFQGSNVDFIKILAVLFFASNLAQAQVRTVEYVDTQRFMGTWYVMGGRFTPFEKDVFNAVEKYEWNPKKKMIEIDFRYNQGTLNGPLKIIPQSAWITNHRTNATWKVSPFWPLRFTYLVIALDEDYEWTAIGVPDKGYLWIMARSPLFSEEQMEIVLNELERIQYPTQNLVFVEHRGPLHH